MNTRLAVSPNWLACLLAGAVLILGSLSIAGHLLDSKHLLLIFELDAEGNVPSWFSSLTLLGCAVLLGVIGKAKREVGDPYVRHWSVLAVLFLYVSLDEAAKLHDWLNVLLTAAFHPSGVLHFPWVLPAAAALVGLALAYRRWLFHLPGWVRTRFLLSAVIFLAGALGCEVLEGFYVNGTSDPTIAYVLITHIEELLEMTGVVAFLHSLMLYASDQQIALSVEFAGSRIPPDGEDGRPGDLTTNGSAPIAAS